MKLLPRSLLLASILVAHLSCGSGSNSQNSPIAPGNTTLVGVWTGTVTRPAGFAPLSVRWETGLNDFILTGPVTLTNGGVSVTTNGQSNLAGNDQSGYTIHLSFMSSAPGCTVRGNTSGSQLGDPFPQPFRTISVPVFDISYNNCQAFIDPGGVSNFRQETVQVNLTKQ